MFVNGLQSILYIIRLEFCLLSHALEGSRVVRFGTNHKRKICILKVRGNIFMTLTKSDQFCDPPPTPTSAKMKNRPIV